MEIAWHQPLENVVKKMAEQAQANSWAHNHASLWCQSNDTRISMVSIILSIFSGAGAVGTDTILPFPQANIVIGMISLLTSIIQAINSKFIFAKRAEAHRISSLAYNQIYNKLNIQLNMPRNERMPAQELLNWISSETERLTEVEPSFPSSTKLEFHKKFSHLEDYSLPLALNGLQPITVISDFPANSSSVSLSSAETVKKPVIKVLI